MAACRMPATVRHGSRRVTPGIRASPRGKFLMRNAPAPLAVPARPASGAASKGSGLGTGRSDPRLRRLPPPKAILPAPFGWSTSMPNDRDLFVEEQQMSTMSFGEHIEELRVRLILALIGLFGGVIVAFIPPLDLGWRVMQSMQGPAKTALERFYRNEYAKKAQAAEESKAVSPTLKAL